MKHILLPLILVATVAFGTDNQKPLEDMQSTHRGNYDPSSCGGSLSFRITSSAQIIPNATNADQNIVMNLGTPDAQNTRTLTFQSRADTDYRFDYTTDFVSWYRLHSSIVGNGGVMDIPVPQSFRAGECCFVRAISWRR